MRSYSVLRATLAVLVAVAILVATVVADPPRIYAKIGTLAHREVHIMAVVREELAKSDSSWTKELQTEVMPYLAPPKSASFDVRTDHQFGLLWVVVRVFEGHERVWNDVGYRIITKRFRRKVEHAYLIHDALKPGAIDLATAPWLKEPDPPKPPGGPKRQGDNPPARTEKRSTAARYNDSFAIVPDGKLHPSGNSHRRNLRRGDDPEPNPKQRVVGRTGHADLQVLSQPRSHVGPTYKQLPDEGTYWSYASQGAGQVVYVMDSGFDITHPDVSGINLQDVIFPGYFPWDELDDDFGYHGTAVASKIAGRIAGVARNVEMVIVRMNNGLGLMNLPQSSDAFLQIRDHIQMYNSDKNCIINLSTSYLVDDYGSRNLDTKVIWPLWELENVILVVSAGNGEKDQKIDTSPAQYLGSPGMENMFGKKFVVVGAYNQTNGDAVYQTAPFVKVTGPDPSQVAGPIDIQHGYHGNPGAGGLLIDSGTSFAVPAVTGTLAMWLGAEIFTIDNVVEEMYKLAYKRKHNGPNVLYNGIKEEQWPKDKSCCIVKREVQAIGKKPTFKRNRWAQRGTST
ncbi:hypothetical protein TWF281_003772 [Arthrobotrys megalospora]